MTTKIASACAMPAFAIGLFAAPASAQQPTEPPAAEATAGPESADCPPGAVCEKTAVTPPAEPTPPPESEPAPHDGTTVVLPPPRPGQDPYAPRTFTYQPDPEGGPGQIIIYDQGATTPYHLGALEPPPPPPPPKKKKKWRRHRQWGMNLRIDGLLIPEYSETQASGMAGLGLSLRYRPTPMFALDLSADFIGGTDANGLDRQELPIGIGAMLYANPRDLAQFYVFGGLNWSFARVFSDVPLSHLAEGTRDAYTYFGGHAGLGVEFRVSRLIGINIDGLAIVRTRTDSDEGGLYPEYYNPRTGESSNSSAAGMLRAGVTFWW